MRIFTKGSPLGKAEAFTLVEIVLAVGVFVVSFLSILALIPIGLENQSQAKLKALEVRILGIVGAEVRQTPFSELASGSTDIFPDYYFDETGIPVDTEDEDAIFSALVESIETDLEVTGSRHPALVRAIITIKQGPRVLGNHAIVVPDTGI